MNPPIGGDEILRRLRAVVEGLRLTGSGERQAAARALEEDPADDDATPSTNQPAQGCAGPLQ